ncbi:MAG: TonB-dependent receptor plug domain-containing protein [Bacteroidota bacterium]
MKGIFKAFLIALGLIPSIVLAQVEEQDVIDRFEKYHLDYPVEKVYLHTSRESLTLGDTLYIAAYVLDGQYHRPTRVSGLLHVELISPQDKIVSSIQLSIDTLGRSHGDFAISDSLDAGNYTLRAYTQYQLNFDQDYLFTKSIKLLPRLKQQEVMEELFDHIPEIRMDLFPEGGELIAGSTNSVAFKTTDQYGNPVVVSGVIIDESGKKVADVVNEHDGMGVFRVFPNAGSKYICNYEFSGRTFSQPLPSVLPAGYILHVRYNNHRWFTQVKPQNVSIEETFLVIQCRGKVLYIIRPQQGASEIRFSLKDTDLPNGIIQLTYFDTLHRAVAERLIYNENPGAQMSLSLATDKKSYHKRDHVNLDLSLDFSGDETPGLATLSTTVLPKSLYVYPIHTISSFLLLTSDLKGYIHNPYYYVDRSNPDRLKHTDLLMMTHGWRRFDWERVINGHEPDIDHFLEVGIRVEGSVQGYINRKKGVVSDVTLSFMENPMYILQKTSLEDGLFWFDGLDFTDTLTAIVKTLSPKEKKRDAGKVNSNTFIQIHEREIPSVKHRTLIPYHETPTDQLVIRRGEKLFDIASSFDERTIVLDAIQIEDRAIKPDDPFKNRSGMIYNTPSNRVVLDSFPATYQNIFQYLYTVPGVQVIGTPPNATVNIRGAASFNSPTAPLYVLDGIPMEEDFINNLNPQNVLFIDVLKGPAASIYGARGGNGVIAIYSRGAGDFRKVSDYDPVGLAVFPLVGFTAPRQFYMPNYSHPSEREKVRPDFRSTIYWNPLLKVEGGMATDQFFTSDETGEFIIYSEGITMGGDVFSGYSEYKVE